MDFSRLVGAPYKKGGSDANGFDCYGLVRFVAHAARGVDLPEKPIGWRRCGRLLGKDAPIRPFDISGMRRVWYHHMPRGIPRN
mgnify:CR=1 FL=1